MAHESGVYQYTVHLKKHVHMETLLIFDNDTSSLMGYAHADGIVVVHTGRKQMRQFAQTCDWIRSYDEGVKLNDGFAVAADRYHWFIYTPPTMDMAKVKLEVQKLGPDAFVEHCREILHLVATDSQITNFCYVLAIKTDCRRGAKYEIKD